MKNNRKGIRTLLVLCAVLVLMCGITVTAYAQAPTEETDDSGVILPPQPLTPQGNMELIDDIQGEKAEDKQFIVVQSRGGNYFYIVIDHAAEGENSVHFLNQVDEADLLSIIEEDSSAATQPPAVCSCTDKCEAGAINTACPVCSVNMNGCAGKAAEIEPPTEPEEKSSAGGLVLFLVIALLGGGGALYYFKVMKPKQSVKGGTDLDDLDFDEYDEDEPEADTPQEDEDE